MSAITIDDVRNILLENKNILLLKFGIILEDIEIRDLAEVCMKITLQGDFYLHIPYNMNKYNLIVNIGKVQKSVIYYFNQNEIPISVNYNNDNYDSIFESFEHFEKAFPLILRGI